MTQDYKETLLRYLVGALSTDKPTIKDAYVRQSINGTITFYNDIPNGANIYGYTSDINNNYIIVYGGYSNNSKGFVLIANFEFQTVQLITKYAGGTDLPCIYQLKYDENGKFYGVTDDGTNKYLVLWNNFCLTLDGTYNIVFRKSYKLTGELANGLFAINGCTIQKQLNGDSYVFIAPHTLQITGVNDAIITKVIVSTLKIQVGSDNEWIHTMYDCSIYIGNAYYDNQYLNDIFSSYATWLEDNYYYKFGGTTGNTENYVEYKSSNGGTLTSIVSSFKVRGALVSDASGGVAMTTYNKTFIAVKNRNDLKYEIYMIDNLTETKIFNEDDLIPSGTSSYFIMRNNNNNIVFAGNGLENMNLGMILNDEAVKVGIASPIWEGTMFFSKTQFNLVSIYQFSTNNDYTRFLLIYNSNNYNGEPYEDINSLIPNSGVLYSDNIIVFARNLYNRSTIQNTTQSTIQIPNNYLNDIALEKQDLITETEKIAVDRIKTITKNIYEELLINYYNTIKMENRNNPEAPIENLNGAVRLNSGTSSNDYDNIKIGKLKTNYQDGTSDYQNISITDLITTTDNQYVGVYNIRTLIKKQVDTFELVSSDEATSYLTIDGSSLEAGKYYMIIQNVTIKEE